MRTSLILALAASGALFGASRLETATYVDGNVAGIAPNTGGTLAFDDDKAMYLRTGGNNDVVVPYAGISRAELGAVKEISHDVPFYKKVWVFHHRSDRTETQYLVVEFKTEQGDDRTMTLELAKSAAAGVLADLESRTGKTFSASGKRAEPAAASKQSEEWWGDEYWKTPRNADKWNKAAGSQEQH